MIAVAHTGFGRMLAALMADNPPRLPSSCKKHYWKIAVGIGGGFVVISGAALADLIVEGANSPFTLSSGTLTNGQTIVGKTGTGVLNQSGGTNNAGILILGDL